jgi:hypothetical protein
MLFHFDLYVVANTFFSNVIGLLSSMSDVQQRTILKDSSNPRVKDIREIELLLLEKVNFL